MTKEELRECVPLETEYVANASDAIESLVTELPEYKSAQCVFVYMSMQAEPQTRGIIKHALNAGKRVCVPKCTDKTVMKAVQITEINCLVKGKMGIFEPSDGKTVAPDEIDIALIPCVRADGYGNRLGHGAGYYDRYLKSCGAFRACMCFGKRFIALVPSDEHDITMDCVITENGVIRMHHRFRGET